MKEERNEARFSDSRFGKAHKLRTSLLLAGGFFLLLIITGCRYTAAPADLLQKPVIAADKQALVSAVSKALPNHSVLTLPLRDDFKEAIRLVDVDGDSVAEAVVTYFNEYNTPELMVLKQSSGSWKPWVIVEQPLARHMDWLKIADLNNDGQLELIIGWVGSFDSPNTLEVYSFQSKAVRNDKGRLTLTPVESLPYIYAEAGDLNEDKNMELAVITMTGMGQEADLSSFQLYLYNWNGSRLKTVDEVELANDVHSYDRMIVGKISPWHYGIVVEGPTGAHNMYTAMYVLDGSKLRLVYPIEALGHESLRGKPTVSEDINGDGIIELNWVREAPDNEDLPYSDSLWINDRMQWNGDEQFIKISEDYIDYRYDFKLTMPKEWIGRYTLRNPVDEIYGIVTVDYWNEQTNNSSMLATIFAVPQKQWEAQEAEWKAGGRSYRVLKTGKGNVYAVSFAQDAPEAWTAAEKEAFREMMKVEERLASYCEI